MAFLSALFVVLKLTYVGDANTVERSLAIAAAHLNVRFSVAAPAAYQFDTDFLKKLENEFPQAAIEVTTDPVRAVHDADAIYTDVWTSMGQEAEAAERREALQPFQVNADLISAAPMRAIFLHCLPARRGEEVTDEVIDSPQSAIIAQAGNRLHVQKGLMAWLLASQS